MKKSNTYLKTSPQRETPGPDGLSDEFYKHLRERWYQLSTKTSGKQKSGENFPTTPDTWGVERDKQTWQGPSGVSFKQHPSSQVWNTKYSPQKSAPKPLAEKTPETIIICSELPITSWVLRNWGYEELTEEQTGICSLWFFNRKHGRMEGALIFTWLLQVGLYSLDLVSNPIHRAYLKMALLLPLYKWRKGCTKTLTNLPGVTQQVEELVLESSSTWPQKPCT